ncbi:positive regulator of sigma E activity [Chryseobacterium sp. W4I1]|nr:positive regulator of sigma E activity [Chryseobacterium sp. W4I1]
MGNIHLYILTGSFLFLVAYSLLQYDFFFYFTPLVFIALAVNFYFILKFKNKVLYSLLNCLLLITLVYFAVITVVMRDDWDYI